MAQATERIVMFDLAFAVETEMNKTSTPAEDVGNMDGLGFRHSKPQTIRPVPEVEGWKWDGITGTSIVDNQQYRKWQGWMSNKMDNTSSYDELVKLMKDIRPCVNRRLVFENC